MMKIYKFNIINFKTFYLMKNLIFILSLLFGLSSFSQENTELYLNGYRVGEDLAKACDNGNRRQIYSNTINAGYGIDYTNGVREGWNANIYYCQGTEVDPDDPTDTVIHGTNRDDFWGSILIFIINGGIY